jgi:hypothetical protein
MAATTHYRDTKYAGLIPARGTYEVAANVLLLGGTICTVDADGRADVVTAQQNACGKLSAHFDNRTTAPEGGAAGAIDAEVEYGVFGWAYTGTTPEPQQVVYVVDNQTVSTDSDTGARGIAGLCTEVRDGQCYVWMGPHVIAEIVNGAAVAANVASAEADITDLQTDMSLGRIDVPLNSFRLASGAAIAAWADGTTDGFAVDEGLILRWNTTGTTVFWTTVALPPELDGTQNVEVHILASRTGAGDAATATITLTAFYLTVGAAYDADDNAGGATGLVAGATKVVNELTRTITAANTPDAGPCALALSMVPTTGTIPADDLNVHAVWLEFTKTLTATP